VTELAPPPTMPLEVDDLVALDRPIRVEEYMRLPEGPPYSELIHGELHVNPPPLRRHQRTLLRLVLILEAVRPAHLEVLPAPIGWRASPFDVPEPDIVVCNRIQDLHQHLVEEVPALCVEILSPSNRRHDTVHKRRLYEAHGVPSYWIVDPDPDLGPRLLALELRDGTYRAVHDSTERFEATLPFPISVDPGQLLE